MAEIITQDTAVLSAQARLEPNISVEHPFSQNSILTLLENIHTLGQSGNWFNHGWLAVGKWIL